MARADFVPVNSQALFAPAIDASHGRHVHCPSETDTKKSKQNLSRFFNTVLATSSL
jgi:hypothetical protein